MSRWKSEAERYLTLLTYWYDYRYKRPMRGTLLGFECDIFLEDLIADGPFDEGQDIGGDWLRRYMDGSINRKTGEYYYTIPRQERLEAVRAFIAETDLCSAVALSDHQPIAPKELKPSHKLANQSILSGVFRGWYHAQYQTPCGLEEAVMMIHHLDDEPCFRVRMIQARHAETNSNDCRDRFNQTRFDTWSQMDCLGVFGTQYGGLFGGDLNSDELKVSNFSFAKRNRRVLELRLESGENGIDAQTFTLCQQPQDIEQMIGFMHSVSDAMNTPLAAE